MTLEVTIRPCGHTAIVTPVSPAGVPVGAPIYVEGGEERSFAVHAGWSCQVHEAGPEQPVDYAAHDLLPLFKYRHLPLHLQEVSKPFHDLALQAVERLKDRPACLLTETLWKLFAAKNAFVASLTVDPTPKGA